MISDGPGHASASAIALTVWIVVGADGDLRDVDVAVGRRPSGRGPSSASPCPRVANLATAPRGVAFDAWPPVFEYTSVSSTRMLTLRPEPARGRGRRSRCRRPSRRRRRSRRSRRTSASARRERARRGVVERRQRRASRATRSATRRALLAARRPRCAGRRRRASRRRASSAQVGASAREQPQRVVRSVRSTREPDARGRTRRCPRTASSPRPGRARPRRRPRRRRQVAAVDRRAAGRVGDDDPVAEELGEQLEVGRLAAAGAGAGELEQRLQQLRPLHRVGAHRARRSTSGSVEEVLVPARRSTSRCSSAGIRSIALCSASALLAPGTRPRRSRSRCSRRARPAP